MNRVQENNFNNDEMADLGTHAAGAVDLHKTRTTAAPVQINPPAYLVEDTQVKEQE